MTRCRCRWSTRPIPGRAGAFYTVFVSDLTQNKYGTLTGLTGTPGRHAGDDKTAEIITEAPGGGPSGYNNNPSHTALLNTGSVYYTYGQVVTWDHPGEGYGISPRPEWNTVAMRLSFTVKTGFYWWQHRYYWAVILPSALSNPGTPSPKGGGGTWMQDFHTNWVAG